MDALTVGVVADTHVPDRARELHPDLLPALSEAGVQMILHAGDICVPAVLEQLARVAPVRAVRGNRDWAFAGRLAGAERIDLAGVPVALVHGHGTLRDYLQEKLAFLLHGYSFQRYRSIWAGRVAGARAVIFGHSHYPENAWHEGRLWFNPGSAAVGLTRFVPPSFGLLRIADGQISGQIVELTGAKLAAGRWVRDP